MAIFHNEPARFDNTSAFQENAEKHRVSVSRQVVANIRPPQPDNGDYVGYADGRGSFSKGLKHDALTGLVDSVAFAAFTSALDSPRNAVFTAINGIGVHHLGMGLATRKWVNPVAGRAFAVVGGDPQQFATPAPPAFGTDALSFEIVENYWMAALRDVPFHLYSSHPVAQLAASELSAFHRAAVGSSNPHLAPTDGAGNITPSLLFRGLTSGDRVGPYLSQFLIHPVPFGTQGFAQRNRTLRPGQDFMTQWSEWLQVQNGADRSFGPSHFDDQVRYMRNGRDLSQWVHIDVLFQGYFNACLVLLQGPGAASSVGGGLGIKSSTANPYTSASLQEGFGTLGAPGHIGMMCEVAALALKAVWFQKWFVHLRMRPEVYSGRIDFERRNPGTFGLPAPLMNSLAVTGNVARYGSALLPMAFPEGSPMHPAYGAGHATVAGACVTILKALFNTTQPFPTPVDVMVDLTGQEHIEQYSGGAPLTIEGELNKLASNVALGRNIAGVHWRSDGTDSLVLGEHVAIKLLEAYARSYAEFSPGDRVFVFNKFDGTSHTVFA